jgi:TPR repeat protein
MSLAASNLLGEDKPKEEKAESARPAPLSEREENVLLIRASNLLGTGEARTALSIYEGLANRGSARGALAIAESYDPKIVANSSVKGLKPDAEAARRWYKKAAELGSGNAAERLKALD